MTANILSTVLRTSAFIPFRNHLSTKPRKVIVSISLISAISPSVTPLSFSFSLMLASISLLSTS